MVALALAFEVPVVVLLVEVVLHVELVDVLLLDVVLLVDVDLKCIDHKS